MESVREKTSESKQISNAKGCSVATAHDQSKAHHDESCNSEHLDRSKPILLRRSFSADNSDFARNV
jgi:hypothetical protein